MHIVCLDFEGVIIPEIWKGVAQLTEIDELNRTTRDEPIYSKLMDYRLEILDKHGIGMQEVQQVIDNLEPLEGAKSFLDWLRSETQVIILSDTFFEFAKPLLKKLDFPTIFCHSLEIEESGRIAGYRLRQDDQKRIAVQGLKSMNYQILSAGDSYNDLSMLEEAHQGVFFCPPDSIVEEYPQYPVTRTYAELAAQISPFINSAPYPG